jgi:hypothetical protein
MNLSPIVIALQGIGYGAFLTALQGLHALVIAPAPIEETPAGSLATIQPRRRVRRWLSTAVVPLPSKTVLDDEQDDEETLLALGVL